MLKVNMLAMSFLLFACSSTKDESKRIVANDEKPAVSEFEYFNSRGQLAPAKWEYDGYHAQVYLFGKALAKKSNRKFLKTGTSLRQNLFENNLIDTGVDKEAANTNCDDIMYIKRRTPTGRCYFHGLVDKMDQRDKDLAMQVMMGAKGQRFGRNTSQNKANKASREDMMDPNPFEISQRLLTRKDGKTKKAEVINLLAAAWLQSMNHDWFTHGKNSKTKHHSVEGYSGHSHFKKGMHKIPQTRSETEGEKKLDKNGYHYTSRNQVTHWWDASQIYGSDAQTIKKVRTQYNANGVSTGKLMPDGKVAVDEKNKRLIYDKKSQLPITGFHDNWWLGLELIHTLFHLEHNHIIDTVLKPQVGKTICKDTKGAECDNELFEVARLINSALIAKIHTVEWTPALLDHPMLHIAMRGNWFGLRELINGDSEFLRGKLSDDKKHILSGLVGPKTLDLYRAPFTLTEEFVAVYRMHPLVPEAIDYRTLKTPEKVEKEVPIENVVFRKANGQIQDKGAKKGSSLDWMFSFGTSHPGGLMLHNYPTFMSNFVAERNTGSKHTDSVRMDMGAIDILRDRERGVPRYNNFRRALGLPAIKSFEDLTNNPEDIKALKDIYGNDVEKLDLIIGSLAEKDRYAGYAFGNTPFWIFAIMASRRLMADPFFSDYFVPSVYTAAGIKHVQKRNMGDVIVTHYPELRDQFYDEEYRPRRGPKPGREKRSILKVRNAFRPWQPVYEKVKSKL